VFDSIVNEEVRYPRHLSIEAMSIMRRVCVFCIVQSFARLISSVLSFCLESLQKYVYVVLLII